MNEGRNQPVARVLGDRLAEWAEIEPDRRFVRCGGPWLTFGEVHERTDRLAAGLAAFGVTRGERVALVSPNRIEYILTLFACAKLGAVLVPINTFLRGEFLRHQLGDSAAATLVTDTAGLAEAARLVPSLPELRRVVALDDGDVGDVALDVAAYAKLETAEGPPPRPRLSPSDLASVLYTSGTTGLPKGCMMSHGYYLAIPQSHFENGWYAAADTILTPFPLFHTSGQAITLMSGLAHGAAVCFETEFHARSFIARAKEVEATVLYGVGAMGMAILAQPPAETDRDHAVRLAMWVPMAPEAQAAFEARFGIPVISEGYGQTECTPVTMNPVAGRRKRHTAGRPVENFEVRLVDDDDRDVAVGEVGEIVVRPRRPDVMFLGYWNRPAATVAASRNLWHHTGDSGRADEDGFITFVDRKKDALRRRGENVSSMELEAAIMGHPAVDRAAVHAVPSELTEDDIKVCLTLREGATLEPAELFEFCKAHLPYFAVPRYVEVLDALPHNAMGRIMKHVLRERGVTAGTWDLDALGLVIGRDERR
ncbi:MAG TPA: AMP-binding protein [Acidimicrobiia bacterium]|nr:AMP-binding protein [Acidimicrobiia bacterium]